MPHERNPFEKDTRVKLPATKLPFVMPGKEKHPVLKVQDKLVLNIVDSNRWRKPIYFAVTVSEDNRMGLDPYLTMEGLVYRMHPEKIPAKNRVDIDRTVFMLDKVYRFRGLGDPDMNLNETTHKLLANYAAGYMYVAYALREALATMKTELEALERTARDSGASDSVVALARAKRSAYDEKLDLVSGKLDQCVGLMPWDWRVRALRHDVLTRHGRQEEALMRAREALLIDPNSSDYKKMLVQALEGTGRRDSANMVLNELLDSDSDPWYVYLTLAQNHAEEGRYDSAILYMQQFQESHPGDQRASQLISYYQGQMGRSQVVDTGAAAVQN